MQRTRALMVLLALTLLPAGASAQPAEAKRRDRARTFLVLRITDALKLNEAAALKVSNVIRQSEERRQELIKQRQALEDKLRTALAKQPVETAELTKLINEGTDLDQKLALVPEDAFRELQKMLTVEQQAKLMLFRRDLRGEIRRALQSRRVGKGGRREMPGERPLADE
jgi:hypothetical protein